MNVLALEAACAACSAALMRRGVLVAERFKPMARGHVEALMPMVLDVLEDARVGFDSIGLVAVTIGPGSFTGLRAGLAAARGIALARGIPVVGATTLEVVAWAARSRAADRPIVVAIETRRADLYVQRFAAGGAADTEPAASLPDAAAFLVPAAGCLLAGDGAARLAAAVGHGAVEVLAGPGLPRAADLAAFIVAGRAAGAPQRDPVPFYLHPPEAKLPAAARGPRP